MKRPLIRKLGWLVLIVAAPVVANWVVASTLLWTNFDRVRDALVKPTDYFSRGKTRLEVYEFDGNPGSLRSLGKLEVRGAPGSFQFALTYDDTTAAINGGAATHFWVAKTGAHFVAGPTEFPEARRAMVEAAAVIPQFSWWKRVALSVVAHPFVTGVSRPYGERRWKISLLGGHAMIDGDGWLREVWFHPPRSKKGWLVELRRQSDPDTYLPSADSVREIAVAAAELDKSLAAVVRLAALRMQPVPREADTLRREGKGWLRIKDGHRVMHLEGSAYEIGYQHGKLLAPNIRRLGERVVYGVGLIYSVEKGKWFFDEAKKLVEQQRPYIAPEYFEEMRGLADGSGLSLAEIQAANIFPEFFHCSGAAMFGSATKGGELLHARVLDYMTEVGLQDEAVLMAIHRTGARRWVNVSYAGFIGSVTGMNEKKVCIGEMGGRGEGKWDGTPMSLLVRGALENSDTLDDALEYMRSRKRTCEYYYCVSDGKTRQAAGIAATPEKFGVVHPGESVPLLPDAVADSVLLSAGKRYNELVARVRAKHGQIDAPALLEIIRRPVAMKSNLHNVVFAPEKLTLWIANAARNGPACDQPVVSYSWAELFPDATPSP